mmetsp:Transcript_2379/g.4319  ORF Transcript_2379/g.4319 Transcript_2379/m.4319 type:complete len:86 (+) Transcript_2379:2-259(+)
MIQVVVTRHENQSSLSSCSSYSLEECQQTAPDDVVPRRGRIGTVPPARILSTNNKPEAIVCLISEVARNQSRMQASGGLLDLTCD